MKTRAILLALFRIAGLAGIYLLLAENLSALEVVAAVGSGIIGTIAITSVSINTRWHLSFELKWLRETTRLPIHVVRDSLMVLGALPGLLVSHREHIGEFREIPIARPGHSPQSAGRRAMDIINISMPPNTFVVSVDDSQRQMTIHELIPSDSSPGGSNDGAAR
ncbi:MAG: hypothetical protein ACREP6_04810 [Candidatus Binataceae bacterium]